jgi:hypothetical protein
VTDDTEIGVELTVADGRTVIEVAGEREAAVVVWSDEGQRIYLPPEDFDDPPRRDGAYGTADSPVADDSPYDGPRADSPYESAVVDDSAYQRAGETPETAGRHSTADGFRIVHPAPVTEFRLLR